MANSQLYMSFAGVDGSASVPGDVSNAPAGGAWIALTGCALTSEGKGSHTSGTTALELAPLQVSKLADAATVPLMDAFLRNKPVSNIVITHIRVADGRGYDEYLRYELSDAQIVSFAHDGDDGTPNERLTIVFGKIEITSWDFDHASQSAPTTAMIANEV